MPAVHGRTLVGYDLLILRNGARAAFGSARDRLLLLIALPLLILMAIEVARNASAAVADMTIPARMLAAMVAGFVPTLAIARRLAHLREHSAVAAAALRVKSAAAHLLFWNALPAAAATAILLGGAASLAPPLLLSYGVGGASAWAVLRTQAALRRRVQRRRQARGSLRRLRLHAPSRRQRVADLIASRVGVPRLRFGANILALAALGAVTGAGYFFLLAATGPGRAAVFGALVLFLLVLVLLLLRQQAALLRYLLFLGDGPLGPALVPVALAGAFAAGAVAVRAVVGRDSIGELVLAAAAALLLFAAAALLRGLHFAVRPRRAADLAIQVDIAVLVVTGILMPWLAPPFLALRLLLLHRRALALRRIAP